MCPIYVSHTIATLSIQTGLYFAISMKCPLLLALLSSQYLWIMDLGTVVLPSWLLLWASSNIRNKLFADILPQKLHKMLFSTPANGNNGNGMGMIVTRVTPPQGKIIVRPWKGQLLQKKKVFIEWLESKHYIIFLHLYFCISFCIVFPSFLRVKRIPSWRIPASLPAVCACQRAPSIGNNILHEDNQFVLDSDSASFQRVLVLQLKKPSNIKFCKKLYFFIQ